MRLNERQIEVIRFNNQHKPILTILEGAIRSGKTFLNNMLFVRHVFSYPSQTKLDFIVTGHTLASIDRNVIQSLNEAFDWNIKLNNHGAFYLGPHKIHCFGTDAADSYKAMTGMTASGWYANEIALSHRNSVMEAFNRCSGPAARMFWDTNPDYPEHYVKREYIDKSGETLDNGRVRVKSWHFDLTDNAHLNGDYVENLKQSTPPGMWYDRRIKGLWVAAEGVVYENWRADVHTCDYFEPPKSWLHVRGIDYGYQNPFVCLFGAVDPAGTLYIYDEHYKSETLLADHVALINQKSKDNRFAWTVADHSAQENAELQRMGLNPRNAQKDVLVGIEKVARRLVVKANGRPGLVVMRNCTNLIREFSQYRWAESKDGRARKEEPDKVDDHTMDALRYLTMELDNNSVPVVRVAAFA